MIATVLVSSVAVGGFVFGTIGSSANAATVQAVHTDMPRGVWVVGVTYALCAASTLGGSGEGYIELYNSGTASTVASALHVVYDGHTVVVAPLAGPCTIRPQSATFVVVYALPYVADVNTKYTGYVTTANGAEVLFTGAFT